MRTLELDGVPAWSKIGLGTWQFGSPEWGYGEAYARREAGAILRRALDLGVTLIDTAELYGFGRSERIVAEAIAGRRDEAFLATKLFPVVPLPPVVTWRARASARRLGTQRLDLYQLHWRNPLVPPGVTMPALAGLQREGLVAEVGVSNYPLAAWRAAERALGGRVLSNQVEYSLAVRRPARGLPQWAQANGRVVIAFSPLAQGLLSGRYRPGHTPGGMRAANPLFLPDNLALAEPLLEILREVAAAHDATPAQVALAWVIRHPNVVAIPGASTVAQLERNAAAADLELAEDEAAALTAASDAFRPVRGPGLVAAAIRRRSPAS